MISFADNRPSLEEVGKAYDNGFEERYAAICAKRRKDQIERAKKRVELEKMQTEKLIEQVNPEKYNKFKWCKKVSRHVANSLKAPSPFYTKDIPVPSLQRRSKSIGLCFYNAL